MNVEEKCFQEIQNEKLPTFCYWLLPVYLLSFPFALYYFDLAKQALGAWPLAFFVYLVSFTIFLGVPSFIVSAKIIFCCMVPRLPFFTMQKYLLKLYKLPPDITEKHGWFKFVYYGSYVFYVAGGLMSNFLPLF